MTRGFEEQRVRELADAYRDRGFEVKIEPRGRDLPPPLRDFQPDLVARRGDEIVVIEVAARPDLRDSRLTRLAAIVEEQPNMRLELVVRNPRPRLQALGESLSLDAIEGSLAEAEELLRLGHHRPALLLAWSALEAITRQLAGTEANDLRALTPAVAKTLVALGYLHPTLQRELEAAAQTRNRFAHGFALEEGDSYVSQQVAFLISTAKGILSQIPRGELPA